MSESPHHRPLPFVDSRAFHRDNATYLDFESHSDAMLASLQLYHDVPYRIMDLVISLVTDPEFDPKQISLKCSTDILKVAEEAQLKDRMAVLFKGPGTQSGAGGSMRSAYNFPQLVLDEILGIIEAKRDTSLKYLLGEPLDGQDMYKMLSDNPDPIRARLEENTLLYNMSLVHRTWTLPAQRSLGRVLFIRDTLTHGTHEPLRIVRGRRSVFGSWTSTLAVQLILHPEDNITEYSNSFGAKHKTFRVLARKVSDSDVDHPHFEGFKRLLLSFTNLKHLIFESYAPLYTKYLSNTVMEVVQQNAHLEELTLHAYECDFEHQFNTAPRESSFILDPLIEEKGATEGLRLLKIRGAEFSDTALRNGFRETAFLQLINLDITYSPITSSLPTTFLSLLSSHPQPHLDSFAVYDSTNENKYDSDEEHDYEDGFRATPELCTVALGHVRTLQLHLEDGGEAWLKALPYCPSLKVLTFRTRMPTSEPAIERYAAAALENVLVLDISAIYGAPWIKLLPRCRELLSLKYWTAQNEDDEFTPEQCSAAFSHLRSLTLGDRVENRWISRIPNFVNLEQLSLHICIPLSPNVLYSFPSTLQSLQLYLHNSDTPSKSGWFESIEAWKATLLYLPWKDHFPSMVELSITFGYRRFHCFDAFDEDMQAVCRASGIVYNP